MTSRTDPTARLSDLGQAHLAEHLQTLPRDDDAALLAELEALGEETLTALVAPHEEAGTPSLSPLPWISLEERATGDRAAIDAGLDLVRRGAVGVVLLAGGMGTRLGWDAPKGTYPVGPVSKMSLFERQTKTLDAVARWAGGPHIPFAVMTSHLNTATTEAFFHEHGDFGHDPARLRFFPQGTLPAVSTDGEILLGSPRALTSFPDGHGGFYRALLETGTLAWLEELTVEHLFVYQVDNALAVMADPAFVGYHARAESKFSVKAVRKTDPDERVGNLALDHGRPRVVEYMEMPSELAHQRADDGGLAYRAGSIGIYCIDLAYARTVAEGPALPFHRSFKKVPYYQPGQGMVSPREPNAYKMERFIFDPLADAEPFLVMEADRAREFAPLKNATGPDSVETVRELITARDHAWITAAGHDIGDWQVWEGSLEIAPTFAITAEGFAERLDRGDGAVPEGATELFFD